MRVINIMAGFNLAASNYALHLGFFIVTLMIPLPEVAEEDEVCYDLVPYTRKMIILVHGIMTVLIFIPTVIENLDCFGIK